MPQNNDILPNCVQHAKAMREVEEKLIEIFKSFNDDVFLSNSEAETYGITIWDYAQQHPDGVLNNYLNECLKCYEELVEWEKENGA